MDRQIFNGSVNTKMNFKSSETKFDNNKIDELLKKYKDDIVYPNDNDNELVHYLGKTNFFFNR